MKDIIKMVRPSPKNDAGEVDTVREALYGYMIDKDVALEKLPASVQAFEGFKKGSGILPDVPFEMLTALELGTTEWTAMARRMSWTQLRMNLNTLHRHGVFKDAASDASVRELFFDGAVRTWAIHIPDFGTVRGPFQVTGLEYAGEHDGEVTYEIALESAGALVFAAA